MIIKHKRGYGGEPQNIKACVKLAKERERGYSNRVVECTHVDVNMSYRS